MFSNRPKYIHCWGGLGSQLYAISFALDLQDRAIKTKVIFHNSGITRRDLEAESYIAESVNYVVVEDYSSLGESSKLSRKYSFKTLVVRGIGNILKFIGVVGSVNTDKEYKKIRPWTLVMRGHYSYRKQNLSTINRMYKKFFLLYSDLLKPIDLVLHYRLDDIVGIPGKSVIESSRVVAELIKLERYPELRIYSDSPKEVGRLMYGFIKQKFSVSDEPTESLIINGVNSKCFIGTVSKVSFWIVFFRVSQDLDSINIMPSESRLHLFNALGDLSRFKGISFY